MNSKTRVFRNSQRHPWTYCQLDSYQQQLAKEIREIDRSPEIIFSEVAPVITFGKRNGGRNDVMVLPSEFHLRGIDIHETSRGGFATYHGPGQWVVFIVDRIRNLTGDPKGIRKIIGYLLRIALRTAQQYDSKAEIKSGKETGIWGSEGKIASVGIQIDQGVIQHGFAVNGFKTRESFFGVRPCGLDAKVQYLIENQDEVKQEEDFVNLRKMIENHFTEVF